MPRVRGWSGASPWSLFTPDMGPGLNDYALTFGVMNLAGTGANPRFLWPGSGRTVAQPEEIGMRVPMDSILRTLFLRQSMPPVGQAATLTYEALRQGLATGATLSISASGTEAMVTGLNVSYLAGQRLSLSVTRDQNHATVQDVTLAAGLEVA